MEGLDRYEVEAIAREAAAHATRELHSVFEGDLDELRRLIETGRFETKASQIDRPAGGNEQAFAGEFSTAVQGDDD